MIKDIENKYAFVHIHCNAGTALEYWLMQLNKHPNWKDRFQWVIPSTGRLYTSAEGSIDVPVHDQYEAQLKEIEKLKKPIYQHMHAKYSNDPNLKLYCIIRNPWERELTSWFHMSKWFGTGQLQKHLPNTTNYQQMLSALETFESWVRFKYLEIDPSEATSAETLYEYAASATLRTSNGDNYSYTHDDAGNDLIDTYIRYENLQEDWNAFAQKAGYPADIFKVKINSNRKSEYNDTHYSYFYNDAIREILDPYCQRDCQRFGYEFETVD